MKPLIHRILSIASVAFAWHLCASAQVEQKTTSKDRSRSAYANCYDASTNKYIGSNKSRTSVLMSPDGRYRAYAESTAVMSQRTNPATTECRTTSKLFVAGPKSQKFRLVLIIKPLPERDGNDIELVDWSPVGHRLLLAQGWWAWGSEIGETVVRTYDADSEKLSSKSLVNEAFSRYFGKHCAAVFEPVGFSSISKIIVIAQPWFNFGEDRPADDSCVQKKGLWLIDSVIPAVSQLPDNYNVQHYSKDAP